MLIPAAVMAYFLPSGQLRFDSFSARLFSRVAGIPLVTFVEAYVRVVTLAARANKRR